MQTLAMNMQPIYYAMYSSYTDIMKDGYKTGDKEVIYHAPVSMWANISPARGSAVYEPFGVALDYDRTIVTADMYCPIDEHSVLWIGTTPNESPKHNYVVKGVARSLNSITYAVKEVRVS